MKRSRYANVDTSRKRVKLKEKSAGKRVGLMDLAAELRNVIYELAADSTTKLVRIRKDGSITHSSNSGLMLASKAVRSEFSSFLKDAAPRLVSLCIDRFDFGAVRTFASSLTKTQSEALRSVKLHLDLTGYSEETGDMEVITQWATGHETFWPEEGFKFRVWRCVVVGAGFWALQRLKAEVLEIDSSWDLGDLLVEAITYRLLLDDGDDSEDDGLD